MAATEVMKKGSSVLLLRMIQVMISLWKFFESDINDFVKIINILNSDFVSKDFPPIWISFMEFRIFFKEIP
ncbi:hypothetical protein SAMN04488033_12544 [Salegentibacter agarivorans]|jgi:hypothetical protein|uniref:Uncharacterized protein n=1 Tax=Salegentibacter agarivorans TaxID=345907 RepID=A0A1I2NX88_9FLAO|nr:hypothetical protein AO058_15280 [Salegentibacter sp. T436]SFG08143.1 hypothetical protein SAMN04488033_12544 [Salegentibacter agarivorans]